MNQAWFRGLVAVALVLGICFRFVNIDRKVYWHDEVYTSLRISGYKGENVVEQVFDGRVIRPQDLLKYQRISPEKNLADAMDALKKHPEHPPLYYIIARFWSQFWGQFGGSSVAGIRSLSAWISLLVFPSVYWLCWELFAEPLVGWIAIALIAICPLYVLYAQEAREYSLWLLTILLSGAALLRAMRLDSKRAWFLYFLTLVVSLYTSLFSTLVATAYSVWVLASEGFRWTRRVTTFAIASLLAVLAFVPWVLVIFGNLSRMLVQTNWITVPRSLWYLIGSWELNISYIFIDFDASINIILVPRIIVGLLIGISYTIYYLWRKESKRAAWFVIALIAIPALALILPDLILGGRRSTVARYFFPCYLGIQLAVAYLLADRISISRFSLGNRRNTWAPAVLGVLISAGVLSCGISSQADTWWHKVARYRNPQAARIINQTPRPLVISDNWDVNFGNLISISYLLEDKVRLQLVDRPQLPEIASGFSDIFLFAPSPDLLLDIEKKPSLKIEPLPEVNFPIGRLKSMDGEF
ncbi:MAG: hypothetical protein F6J93_07665 [Oscillatoria sp. SIO1A7]|nr:hypothetical protein [Oscillatoria sp. SIO1A7]